MKQKKQYNSNNLLKKHSYSLSRRGFVKLGFWGIVLSQLPFGASCNREQKSNFVDFHFSDKLYSINIQTIRDVQNILFPTGNPGPGAEELKSENYLLWILSDPLRDPWDNEYILKGFKRLDQKSNKHFGNKFSKLDKKEQEKLIEILSLEDKGQSWLSTLLTLIFESMFANPNYGSNPGGMGWKWLNHRAGMPQPDANQIYPVILQRNKEKFLNQIPQ